MITFIPRLGVPLVYGSPQRCSPLRGLHDEGALAGGRADERLQLMGARSWAVGERAAMSPPSSA